MPLPTFDDVAAAAGRLHPHAVRTPLVNHPRLDSRVGARVLLKAESLQRVGAFKFRGAYNAVSQVDAARYPGGVVACSSGNHAQGVAEAARLCGMKSAIVMPSDAPALKIARTRDFGGEVILYDRVKEDRDAIAKALCEKRGAAFIHPFDDPNVIAGQGTVGLELIGQAKELGLAPDAVLAPCSGGGLITGIATAVKHFVPAADVYAVEPAGFDDMARSLASGKHERNARMSGSICDALMAPSPGIITLELAKRLLKGSLTVTDEEARAAVRYAFEELKLVVEPGGAVALAAVLTGKLPVEGRTIAVVLSGGNVDPALYGEIIGTGPDAETAPPTGRPRRRSAAMAT